MIKIRKQLKLTDFPINIDTLCFKLKCELSPKCYEHWEIRKFNYYQTIRTVGGSNISFRYYPWYERLSIWVDSVPCLVYGSSQILFNNDDYIFFKELVINALNNAMGFINDNGFDADILDYAILSRFDLNQDYYFCDKKNEIEFRAWINKCKMPYAKNIDYETGGKKTRNALNLTFYSKDEQCQTKHNEYLESLGKYCTRLEIQIKSTYLNKQPPIYLSDFINDEKIRNHYFNYLLEKLLLNGEIMNRQRLDTFLKNISTEKHKTTYCKNIKSFYLNLGKYGYQHMKEDCKSYYYYLQVAKSNKKVPIRLNDSVFKELCSFKRSIYYSCND